MPVDFCHDIDCQKQHSNSLVSDLAISQDYARYTQSHSIFYFFFFSFFHGKAHGFQGYIEELYIKLHMSRTRIYFIGIKAFTINNERITLETMDKELLDMPLNCRGSLMYVDCMPLNCRGSLMYLMYVEIPGKNKQIKITNKIYLFQQLKYISNNPYSQNSEGN